MDDSVKLAFGAMALIFSVALMVWGHSMYHVQARKDSINLECCVQVEAVKKAIESR